MITALAPAVAIITVPDAHASTDATALALPHGATGSVGDALRLPACESRGRSLDTSGAPCADDLADALAAVGRFPDGPPIAPVAVAEPPAPTAKAPRRKARR